MSATRTNLVIDDDLLGAVLAETGIKTKREAVQTALETLLRLKRQERVRAFRGKLEWEGELEEMRRDK
jgi:Arc/MetJ family transcription regulator